jgi:hypothetical protein
MKRQKPKPKQLALFADHADGQIHALGLLGYGDALWTKPIEIELISGQKLIVNLETIRRLQRLEMPAAASQGTDQTSTAPNVSQPAGKQ